MHSYRYDFIDPARGKVEKSFKTFSEYYFLPNPQTIAYHYGTDAQSKDRLRSGTAYELRVYAIDAYGNVSDEPLSAVFTTLGEPEALPQGPAPGDMNGSGSADTADALFLLMIISHDAVGAITDENVRAAADANGDDAIDIRDVVLILQIAAGLTEIPGS